MIHYENNNDKSGGRNKKFLKKGFIAAAVVVCVAVVTVAIYFARAGEAKTPSSSASASALVSAAKATASVDSVEVPSVPVVTTNRIPVLMYHSINFDPKFPTNILRIPTPYFAAEMKWLYDNGYKTLTLDQLYEGITQNQPFPEKSVVLTFDDGYEDNYTNAFPILKQYHFNATLFMITDRIGDSKNGYLTADQLKEMDKNGMSIEGHTVHHLNLDSLTFKQQYSELADSKTTLETLLNKPIYYMAFPSGKYNADTIKAEKQIGYKICFKENGGIGKLSDSQYEFPRLFVGKDLQDFINRVTGKLNLNSSSAS
jgi:peptidoglycan/xylan/chitin deacetylase (PgdA/CDA1 family)